jgi:hypothetical protein
MKILFEELFKNASVIATNQSLNYPVANITHPFLHKLFRSSTTTSLITATFTADQCCSCFFYAYHDITSMTVVYKNSGGGTLLTINVTAPEDIGIEYFTELTTVRSVEITVNGASGFYIGKVGTGCCYEMPEPLANYDSDMTDNTVSAASPYGQILSNHIEPLEDLVYNFRELELETKNEIKSLYKGVGKNNPVFMDLYEDARDKEPPIYGYFTQPFKFKYVPRRYSFQIKIREAR